MSTLSNLTDTDTYIHHTDTDYPVWIHKRKFDELHLDSRQRMRDMLKLCDEWRKHCLWKIQDDIDRAKSFDGLGALALEQGEYFEKSLQALDDYKY